ncbi:MAG: fibronectin type III domain-containing protein [Nitriliruptoraceae bacterium]
MRSDVAAAITGDTGPTVTITEIETGGRPSLRHSQLVHRWVVDVTGGSSVTLFVDASASTSADADSFAFEYSIDNGSSFEPALVIEAGGSRVYSATRADTVFGEVQIRVRDTNRTQGANTRDSIAIDHLFVRSETEAIAAPAAPTDLSAQATGATTVDLTWTEVTDEWGYELERRTADDVSVETWTRIAEVGADVTGYTDTGLTGSTTYDHQIRAYNSGGTSTWTETDGSVITAEVSDITLSTSGYKDKGSHHIVLDWTGATTVNIYRDGTLQYEDISGAPFTDATGGKGQGEYVHQVCAVASDGSEGPCSNEVTTTFS